MPARLDTKRSVENTKVNKVICGPCYLVACILIEATDINKLKILLKVQLYIYTSRVQTPLPTTEPEDKTTLVHYYILTNVQKMSTKVMKTREGRDQIKWELGLEDLNGLSGSTICRSYCLVLYPG